jgi:hypothetical protein
LQIEIPTQHLVIERHGLAGPALQKVTSAPDVENPSPGSDLPTKAAPSRGPKAIRRER